MEPRHDNCCTCMNCSIGAEVGETQALDRELVESINIESIEKSYLPEMAYYSLLPVDKQTHFHPLYGEARKPLFADPVKFKGHYLPGGTTTALTKFGLDDSESAVFLVNISIIEDLLEKRPDIGDLILAFDRPNLLYQINKVHPHAKKLGRYTQYKIEGSYYQHSVDDIDLISRRDLEPIPSEETEEL